MHCRQLSVFLTCALNCCILSLFAEADDSKVAKVKGTSDCEQLGQTFEVELEGLIEGLAEEFVLEIQNKTQLTIKDLTAKVSCGCLNVAAANVAETAPDSPFALKFTVVPTSGGFQQKCVVGGVVGRTREEIFTCIVRGEVKPPIEVERKALPVTVFSKGFASIQIVPVNGVSVGFDSISSTSDCFSVSGDSQNSSITVTPTVEKIEECSFVISIPFTWKERSFTHSFPFEFVDEVVRISPARIYFRKGTKGRVGRAIVDTKGIGIDPKEGNFFLEDGDGNQLNDAVKVQVRKIGSHSALCDVIVEDSFASSGHLLQFRIKSGGEEFVRSVKCIFD